MSKFRLLKFSLTPYLAIPFKGLAVCIALYYLNDVYVDWASEYITRRGNVYSLEESPVAYYINILKRIIFSILGFYFGFIGISVKKN